MHKFMIYLLIIIAFVTLYLASAFLPALLFYQRGYTSTTLAGKKIIGHRGGAGIGAENSIACFRKGIASGANLIEMDIHMTKDNILVVSHDPTVDRMTNGTGSIANLNYDEIARLNIIEQDGHVTDQHIPSFDETLALFADARRQGQEIGLLVEIKRPSDNAYLGLEERMVELIKKYNACDWVIVQSFNDFAIEQTHHLCPELRVEKLLICKLPGLPLALDNRHLIRFDYKKYNYVSSFNFWYYGLNKTLLNDIHTHGKEVKIWTLDSLDAPIMAVDGIITDRPDLWISERDNAKKN